MKKVIILLSSVLLTIGAMAQNDDIKEMKKYTLECLYGRTTLINYPTISMFRKDIPSYSDMNVYINILYNTKENFSWELSASTAIFDIPHEGNPITSETFGYLKLSMGGRLKYSITNKLGMYLSLRFGLLTTQNNWKTVVNEPENINKTIGMSADIFMGVKYIVEKDHYVTFGIGMPIGLYDFQGGLRNGKSFEGYSIMLGFGI